MRRTFTGPAPRTKLPPGSIDAQMHMYMPGFPSVPGSIPLPPAAPGPAEYRQVMAWLGIDRLIVTQGNAHGRDNANVLACLAAMGDCARGVGIVDASTTDAALATLARAGIIGARVMDLPGGAVSLRALADVDAKATAAGWYIAIQFNGSDIVDHLPALTAVRSRWVLDHHGKFLRGAAPDGPEVDALKRLIDKGNCWYKLAGAYESSLSGGPAFEDVAAITRAIAAYAPERVVWGTNWPHNSVAEADYPDDAALLDTVLSWVVEYASLEQIMVRNAEALSLWK